ncbi:MAG: oxidoreductase [Dehalococcoidia bacterium]|nr:MAG: oxidoreductase [Dehalococcoidia bacterium]
MTKTYGVGVIGAGWALVNPVPTFQTYPATRVTAICSRRPESVEAAARRFGIPVALTDYRELIARPDVDIVYICTPVALHHPMVLAAAEAGKPILCEKPLSVDAAQGGEMVDAVESRRLPNIVAFTLRHYPWSLHVKRLVDSGAIGDVRQIVITQFRSDPLAGRSLDVARSGGGLPPQTWTWLHDANQGGGMLGAMGSHYVDIVRFFFGDYQDVSARTATLRPALVDENGIQRDATAEDTFALLATLHNGASLTLQFSSVSAVGLDRRLEFFGSEGAIVVEGDNAMRIAKRGESFRPEPIPTPELSPAVLGSQTPRFGLMIEKLINWIETGHSESPDMRDAFECQRVLDAIRRSSAERRTVRLDEVT